jgi:hypothetical protein
MEGSRCSRQAANKWSSILGRSRVLATGVAVLVKQVKLKLVKSCRSRAFREVKGAFWSTGRTMYEEHGGSQLVTAHCEGPERSGRALSAAGSPAPSYCTPCCLEGLQARRAVLGQPLRSHRTRAAWIAGYTLELTGDAGRRRLHGGCDVRTRTLVLYSTSDAEAVD